MTYICHNSRYDNFPHPLEKELKLKQFAPQTISNLPIRRKTLITYRSMYRCHIEPMIGDCDLGEVKRVQIQELIKPLPPQTSQMTLAVLKTIYREAFAHALAKEADRLAAGAATQAADQAAEVAVAAEAAKNKKTTISCVKGKLTKKVTAVKPVCPKGYKQKSHEL